MVEEKPTLEENLNAARLVIKKIDEYIGLLGKLKVKTLNLMKDMVELEEEIKKAKEK